MKNNNLTWRTVYIICTIMGVLTFICIYGVRIINPWYVDWLLKGGDPSQHYIGWEFYRRSEWFFPFGLTDTIAYPLKTSVIYTDSIPIFAVLFKIVRGLLPDMFQYFGIWGVLCYALQGLVSAKLLREKTNNPWMTMIGSLFFLLSPIMMFRMYYHTALAAHWLILLAIYWYTKHEKEYQNIKKTCIQWGILGVLIGAIHLYFVPMCGAVLIGYILCSFWKDKKIKLKYMLPGVSFGAGLLVVVYLLGGFSSSAESGTNNLGLFSFNLNGLLNPMSYSTLLKNTSLWDLPFYTQGQYEGFNYLGLGILLLCLFGIVTGVVCACKEKRIPTVKQMITMLMSIGLILLAASPTITWNDRLVLQLPYSSTLYRYWSIFGSSGRMVWPVYYFIMAFAISSCTRLQSKRTKKKVVLYGMLLLAFVIQLVDFSDQIRRRQLEYNESYVYESPLAGSIWDQIAKGDYQHIVWVSHNVERGDVIQAAIFALQHDMTMGNFYFARGIDARDSVKEQLSCLSDDAVYVFKLGDTQDYERYETYQEELFMYPCGDYMIGCVNALAP